MLRYLNIAVFAGAVLFSGLAWTAPQQELEELRQRIKALQQELTRNEESKAEASDALRESEGAISDHNRKLFELSKQLNDVNTSLKRLDQQKMETSDAIRTHQKRIGKLFYQQYLEGDPGPLKLFLSGENPQRIARELYYYSYVSRARLQLIRDLQTNLNDLQNVSRQTQQQRAELEEIKASQIEEKKQLDKERQARQKLLAQVSSQIKKQRNEISTLRHDENRLARLVKNLNKMLSEQREAKGLSNNKLPDASFDGTPFKELKGKLSLPIQGEVSNRYGSSRVGGGVLWKGLFIIAKIGQDVKAIAGGRVVYSDWLRGFGNLLIIDHGDNYMSLYGNNETLFRQVGDVVHGGDTIAAVGNSGGNPESGLYFEIRHQGEPFDPLSWVSVR